MTLSRNIDRRKQKGRSVAKVDVPSEIDSLSPLHENGDAGFVVCQKARRRLGSTVERKAGDGGTIFSLLLRVCCNFRGQILPRFGHSRIQLLGSLCPFCHSALRSFFFSVTPKIARGARNPGSKQDQANKWQDQESANSPSLRSIGSAEMSFRSLPPDSEAASAGERTCGSPVRRDEES